MLRTFGYCATTKGVIIAHCTSFLSMFIRAYSEKLWSIIYWFLRSHSAQPLTDRD
jgi:hypothetical protein